MLATAKETFYVHEPMNPNFAPHYLGLQDIPYYWQITDEQETQVRAAFQRLLSGQFPQINAKFFRPERRYISRFPQAVSFRWAGYRNQRFLVKDPFMLFNVEWFEHQFGGQTVLVIRSPLAFVASLKAKNWNFDFRHWTSQPALIDGALAPDREAIEAAAAHPPDLIEQGCILWRVLTQRIHRLAAEDPRRVLCDHESLCQNPEAGFREIFKQLGLTWTSGSEHFMRQGKQAAFGDSARGDERGEAFEKRWVSRLTEDERARIQTLTSAE